MKKTRAFGWMQWTIQSKGLSTNNQHSMWKGWNVGKSPGKSLELKKDKKHPIIVKFTTFRHRILLYRSRRKLKNGVKLHVDLSKKTVKIFLDSQKYVENVEEVQLVCADINCNSEVQLRNNDESLFTSMQALEVILDK